MSRKVLVVDDEKLIVKGLRFSLEQDGMEVDCAYDGEEALEKAKAGEYDIILLDLMLPKMDGFSVCKSIRQLANIPIIMVTAKEDVVDKVIGLELGADHYITKPFSVREVIARVKANLRKWDGIEMSIKGMTTADNEETKNSTLVFGPLVLDTYKYEAKISGKNVELTLREFELLKFLATQKGQVFSREELLEKVWGYEYFGDVRTVDVTIRRIREKIEQNPSMPELLATKRGIGYYFNAV